MDNGTSTEYVDKYPTVNRLQLLYDVATGLEYLHSQRMVHGDLRGVSFQVTVHLFQRLMLSRATS